MASQLSYTARVAAASLGSTGSGGPKCSTPTARPASAAIRAPRRTTPAGHATAVTNSVPPTLPQAALSQPSPTHSGTAHFQGSTVPAANNTIAHTAPITASQQSAAVSLPPQALQHWHVSSPSRTPVILVQSQSHSPHGSRPPSQPPPPSRTVARPAAATRSLSQPASFTPRPDLLAMRTDAAHATQAGCAVNPGHVVLPASTGRVHLPFDCSIESRGNTPEDARSQKLRLGELASEVALLRRDQHEQAAKCRALSQTIHGGGSGCGNEGVLSMAAKLEELQKSVADLQRQQDLQAAALRDGLMEIHQLRADWGEIKSYVHGANGRGHKEDLDALFDRISAESEERRTCIAELNVKLEQEITEVLRKEGRRHEELRNAIEAEREMRNKTISELSSQISSRWAQELEDLKPHHVASPTGLIEGLSKSIEVECAARLRDSAEVRGLLAQLASDRRRSQGQVDEVVEIASHEDEDLAAQELCKTLSTITFSDVDFGNVSSSRDLFKRNREASRIVDVGNGESPLPASEITGPAEATSENCVSNARHLKESKNQPSAT